MLQKLKVELPHDPPTPLLGIYPKHWKSVYCTDTCASIFISVLFMIEKIRYQLRLMDEWIKKYGLHKGTSQILWKMKLIVYCGTKILKFMHCHFIILISQGLFKDSSYTQRITVPPLKQNKFCHLWQPGWTWMTLC